jgi:hypothetical protein
VLRFPSKLFHELGNLRSVGTKAAVDLEVLGAHIKGEQVMVKLTGCLGILFLCSIGIAAAQGVPTLPVSPDTLANLMAKVRRPAAATNGALAQQKDPRPMGQVQRSTVPATYHSVEISSTH